MSFEQFLAFQKRYTCLITSMRLSCARGRRRAERVLASAPAFAGITASADRKGRPGVPIGVRLADIGQTVARDPQVAALLERLDHAQVARLHGGLDPAIAVLDDGVDFVAERPDAPLHLVADARDVAIAGDGELPEIDEEH